MGILKPKYAAEKLGIAVETLQTWDRRGVLHAYRTATNRRYYTDEQINRLLGIKAPGETRINVAYARVSSSGQKDDLQRQIDFIQQYMNANGVVMGQAITDIGSGLNYKRKKWNRLLDQVMDKKIDTIYITYPDRFIRFGFEWFQHFCAKFGTHIRILNWKKSSPQRELVNDLINIIHVFSCRAYGLRKYSNQLKSDKTLQGDEKDGH